jgi:hypothetical protein
VTARSARNPGREQSSCAGRLVKSRPEEASSIKGSPSRKARREAARQAQRADGKQRVFNLPKEPLGRPSARNALRGRGR